jgi:hypothetical protein
MSLRLGGCSEFCSHLIEFGVLILNVISFRNFVHL